jgi:ribosome-binding factor A
MTTNRPLRVGNRIRDELARILMTELADPRLAHVTITRVVVTPDLHMARVLVRSITGDAEREAIIKGLKSASNHIRRILGPTLEGLRKCPELSFHYDDGIEASERIEQILHEIATEPKPEPEK